MQRFIDKHIEPNEGEIVHVNGKVLGTHNGIQHFTLGQRKGLGIAWPEPLYVKSLDTVKNIVYVADKSDLFSNCLLYTSPSPRDDVISRMPSSA